MPTRISSDTVEQGLANDCNGWFARRGCGGRSASFRIMMVMVMVVMMMVVVMRWRRRRDLRWCDSALAIRKGGERCTKRRPR